MNELKENEMKRKCEFKDGDYMSLCNPVVNEEVINLAANHGFPVASAVWRTDFSQPVVFYNGEFHTSESSEKLNHNER